MGRKASFVALIILTMIVAPLSAFHLVLGIWALIIELRAPGIIPIVPWLSLAFVVGALLFLALLAGLWRWYFATNKGRTDQKPRVEKKPDSVPTTGT